MFNFLDGTYSSYHRSFPSKPFLNQGIGFAISKTLIANGYSVILVSKNESRLREAYIKLGAHSYHATDLSKLQNIKKLHLDISKTIETPISVLINAAGITLNSLLLKSSDLEVIECMNTNLHSSILLSKYFSKDLMKTSGSIISIASVIGPCKQQTGQAIYAASKAGLVGFTKAMAVKSY